MKKQLLFLALVAGSILTTNAQTVSFETSEGFTAGPIANQNGWTLAGATMVGANAVVSNTDGSVGTNSLRVNGSNTQSTTLIGVYSPLYAYTDDAVTVSFDLKVDAFASTNSDVYVDVLDQDGTSLYVTSRMIFDYQGTVRVATGFNTAGTALEYEVLAPFVANTWVNIRIDFNFTDGTIVYYRNNAVVYEGEIYNGEQADRIAFRYDNYASGFSVDNFRITTTALSVKDNTLASLSVYPNPSNGIVNISNANNLIIDSVSITDLNGRTVKQFSNNVTDQINISDLSTGMYLMNISTDQGSVTKKIVKK